MDGGRGYSSYLFSFHSSVMFLCHHSFSSSLKTSCFRFKFGQIQGPNLDSVWLLQLPHDPSVTSCEKFNEKRSNQYQAFLVCRETNQNQNQHSSHKHTMLYAQKSCVFISGQQFLLMKLRVDANVETTSQEKSVSIRICSDSRSEHHDTTRLRQSASLLQPLSSVSKHMKTCRSIVAAAPQ